MARIDLAGRTHRKLLVSGPARLILSPLLEHLGRYLLSRISFCR